MNVEDKRILEVVGSAERPLGVGDLLEALGLDPGERTELKRALRELVRAGALSRYGKRWSSAQTDAVAKGGAEGADRATRPPALVTGSRAGKGRFVVGVLRRHEDGFGFVEPLSGARGQDLYLPAEDACRALDGDLVKVEVVEGRRGRPAGRFLGLVEPRRTRAIGTYLARGKSSVVVPKDRAVAEAIFVPPFGKAREGQLVAVELERGTPAKGGPTGKVVAVVGEPGEPMAEVFEAAYGQGFSDAFPADVLAEAARAPSGVVEADRAGRRDLRSLRLVTIDGEDARDFDDAVYVERAGSGYRLVVAIADVAHYVRPGRSLDHEALRRGTSVYFPSAVLPMLPERLSNGLCSLKPDEERLCLAADLIFERAGSGAALVSAEIYEGLMQSAARCTYAEVAQVLAGDKVAHREFLREDFALMEELAKRLIATREERGSLDFDLPEVKAKLGDDGRPLKLEKRERNIAHRIVEEFMLAANEAVARYFSTRALPTVYRVHGEPDEVKLETFLALARAHGFALESGAEISGKALNALLRRIAGSPEQRTLNFLMLRSMMQAIYSHENIGHFGLAAPFYLHFTSPIRRYPDLMVHRLLKEHWARGARTLAGEEREAIEEQLDGISARSSERERAAMRAERDVAAYYAALYLSDKVGEEFDGVVSAVTEFGFFVEITEEFAEGLVKAQSLGEGAWFDPERHRLVFSSGLSVHIGAAARIRVENVSVSRRHIDFALLSLEGKKVHGAAPEGAAEGPPPRERKGGPKDERRRRKEKRRR
jgi:ribonuclease R